MNAIPNRLVCLGGPWHGQVVEARGESVVRCPLDVSAGWGQIYFGSRDLNMLAEEYAPHQVAIEVAGLRLAGWVLRWSRLSGDRQTCTAAMALLIANAMK